MNKLFRTVALILLALATATSANAQRRASGAGELISQQAIAGAPLGATAFRVLYRSTGLRGEPIEVSGMVIVPANAPPGGRAPIVAWAHYTSGIAPDCAPSTGPFKYLVIPGLGQMLARGYIVTATDYPGLGTPETHPYLVGVSEGRAVLDSARAAEQLTGDAGAPVAVWGHSQGGQAALYAGLLARSYAPDLDLVGVAAAAPPTDLGQLLRYAEGSPIGKSLLAMTLASWSRVYGVPLDNVVDPAALPNIERLAQYCLDTPTGIAGWVPAAGSLLQRDFVSSDLAELQPWRSLIARNSVGPLPSRVPVFIAQGTGDELVEPQVTAAYFARLCAARNPATLLMMPGVGHVLAGLASADAAIGWIDARFAGVPPTSNCSSLGQ
ncbi:MAG TPA: alpha/beta fold hydrolase [Devosiaceae bacterium]|nr:alpha/beta fold hydrolase [Devosiaceae bacterium]